MRVKQALLSAAMRVPPPFGPWLIGALIGRRPVSQGCEDIADPRACVIDKCKSLTRSQRIVFMPAMLEEAFGRAGAGVYDLRQELSSAGIAQEFELRLLQNGGVEVRPATAPAKHAP